ncbi:hypothetical protein N7510_010826 [Penicillium lagena]|uniref:uncharacterized protein n=1 Tax=Penicillium lagena TaxID=94218 RepID=UPI0025410406|nr:uncharacterized protein N7510_010826 [Penicillium lagena]KAJ5601292.1 hypothetical protein N7510_010826 [Penicillium lagena]
MQNIVDVSRRLGDLKGAGALFGKVLDARQKQLGPDHMDICRTAEGLANVYRDQRRFNMAEPLYARALSIREDKLGFSHADTLATVHNVAISYRLQGKLDEAKKLYLRAL